MKRRARQVALVAAMLLAPLGIVLLARFISEVIGGRTSSTPLLMDYFVQLDVVLIGYVIGRLAAIHQGKG